MIAARDARNALPITRYPLPVTGSDRFELEALHLRHVHALDADQLGGLHPRRGVQVAFVVYVRDAGRELVGACFFHLARLLGRRRLEQLVIAHLGLAHGLAVDRPVRAVIVRATDLRALVMVREYAEA